MMTLTIEQFVAGYLKGASGYIKLQGSRKLDCTAAIHVKSVRIYTDYKVPNCTSNTSLKKAKKCIRRT